MWKSCESWWLHTFCTFFAQLLDGSDQPAHLLHMFCTFPCATISHCLRIFSDFRNSHYSIWLALVKSNRCPRGPYRPWLRGPMASRGDRVYNNFHWYGGTLSPPTAPKNMCLDTVFVGWRLHMTPSMASDIIHWAPSTKHNRGSL